MSKRVKNIQKFTTISLMLGLLLVSIGLAAPLTAADGTQELRWVLVGGPRINPNNAPKRFDAGITPGYYSDRNRGSFEQLGAGETNFTYHIRWLTREYLEMDVSFTANFARPPRELVPGQPVPLGSNISHSGNLYAPGNPGIIFEYYADGIVLEGETSLAYYPFAENLSGKSQISCHFYTPRAEAGGMIKISAYLKNHVACLVEWIYRPEQRQTEVRGKISVVSGSVEILTTQSGTWAPASENMPLNLGDKIRTNTDALARIELTSYLTPDGIDIIELSSDTEFLVEDLTITEDSPGKPIATRIVDLIKGALHIFTKGWKNGSIFSVKCGTTILGIRGTEITAFYEPRTDRVECRIIDGIVDVEDRATGQRKTLTAGQFILVNNGSLGQVQPLSRDEWDRWIASHGFSGEVLTSQPVDIPSLQATISQLNFYEGGYDGVAREQRQYNTSFSPSNSRYIYWELNLDHPAPGRRIDFTVDAVWTAPDGSEFARQSLGSYLLETWSSSYHQIGRGWREPGNWNPGTYRVDLMVNGEKVASGSFVMTGGGGGTTTQTAYDIPSIQARVTSIQFFEGGFDAIPKEQRRYSIQFSKSSARAIWWELNLEYPDPGRKVDFAIEAVYFSPDGSVLNRQTNNTSIQNTWTTSYHSLGWGWQEPGNWALGFYGIELSVNGKRVASGTFEIR
jgi:hypothetical protein